MSENHREPEVPEEKVPAVECARIASKELAPLHSVKNGTLQSACRKMDADLGKSALRHIVTVKKREDPGWEWSTSANSTSANFNFGQFLDVEFLDHKGWRPRGWMPKPRKSGAPKGGGPDRWRPRRVEAQKGSGQNRIWPELVFQSVDCIWPNRIWPILVF